MAAQQYNERPEFLKANGIWVFSSYAGLDFNNSTTGQPIPFSAPNRYLEGAASVAHPLTGELEFFTDGNNCYNRDHIIMPRGARMLGNGGYLPFGSYGYMGNGSSTQGACVVPVIDSPGKYYLFSLYGMTGAIKPPHGYLFYNVVDMSLDNGLGDIIGGRKNLILYDDTLSESMIAIPGDNCDVWLVLHAYSKPYFLSFHITKEGIDPDPVISWTGSQIGGRRSYGTNGSWGAYTAGGMAVSPDRRYLVIGSVVPLGVDASGVGGTLLCKFDPSTGNVSDAIQIGNEDIQAYIPAFSPDNSKLYIGTFSSSTPRSPYGPISSDVSQFEVSVFDSASIAASKIIVTPPLPGPEGGLPAPMKLYNGRIYFGFDTVMHTIMQPNIAGTACDFRQNSIILHPGYWYRSASAAGYSIPNEVIYPLPATTTGRKILDTLICDQFLLRLKAPAGFPAYHWDDGTRDDIIEVTRPGKYWVQYSEQCHLHVDTFIIHGGYIDFSLGPDTVICSQQIELKGPSKKDAAYAWQDGSKEEAFKADRSGIYTLSVTIDGCTYSDTISLTVKDFFQDLGPDTLFCKEDLVPITLTANVPANSDILWNTGSKEASIITGDTGTYWVVVRDEFCMGTDTFLLRSRVCNCPLNIPTAFSPNGDGRNDIFRPLWDGACPVSNYSLQVFNRFGQLVYYGDNIAKGWDGTYEGRPAEVGTYMFQLNFTGGVQPEKYYSKGDVTLIR